MTRCLALAWLTALAAGAAAQEPSDRLKELERRVEILTAEIERLKLGAAAEEPKAETDKPGEAPAATKVYRAAEKKVSIGGYGEMSIQDFAKRKENADAAGTRDEADFVRAVLYAGYKFNDWILFNSELEFEHGSTGKGRGEVSIEQAYLDFQLHKTLGMRAGLLLVPMGFMNEIHEPTTFHGVQRPAAERLIIPSTWRENGAGFFGEAGPARYRSYVLAGLQAVSNTGVGGFRGTDGLRNGRSSGARSFAEDSAWVSRLDIEPIPGVLAGGSLYLGEADQNLTASAVPVTLWEAHAQAERWGAEVRGLYAEGRIGNADAVNAAQLAAAGAAGVSAANRVGGRIFGGYVQGAYNVLSLWPGATAHYLAPFLRYERVVTQARVPDRFGPGDASNSRKEYTLGLTYKPIPQVAVKLDHQWNLNRARTGVNQLNLGLGYVF